MSLEREAWAETLCEMAQQVRERAYAPYSKFLVGAALLGDDGVIYTGVNLENASFGLTVCAERNAIAQMVGAGTRRFVAAAVATSNGVTPCGACRQVLAEFATGDVPIWLVCVDADEVRQTDLATLLPDAFDQSQLPQEQA